MTSHDGAKKVFIGSGDVGAIGASGGIGFLGLLAMLIGGAICYASKADAHLVRSDLYRAECALAGQRLGAEEAEFARWSRELQDRPTDTEMARWLDYDKLFIKNDLIRFLNRSNRDILAHAVLTEADYPCQRARVIGGPPRYSDYVVTIILLTEGAVRKIGKNLNFLTGELGAVEGRESFSYDSISSASMVKVEVKFRGDNREVVAVDGQAGNGAGPAAPGYGPGPADGGQQAQNDGPVIFGESLRIFHVSGRYVDFSVQNLDQGFLDRSKENAQELFDITMDASGTRAALRLLEDVSSEKGAWIAAHRRRLELRLREVYRNKARARELAEADEAELLPELEAPPLLAELPERGVDRPGYQLPPAPAWEEVTRVAVRGGSLAVEVAVGRTRPVLAIHGFTSQARQWNWLREARPDLSLIMPDLRGRGASDDVGGPSSIAGHVEDMIAVLDFLDVDAALVCGASMGAVIAVELAIAHPDRVRALVLVDGGFPTSGGNRLTPEATPAIIRDRMLNRDREWPSAFEYARSYAAKTSPLLNPADPLLIECLERDLNPQLARRLNCDLLYEDTSSALAGQPDWSRLRTPAWLLTAEWSTGQGSAPAYTPEAVKAIRQELGSTLHVQQAPAVDHASAIMSRAGARLTAELIAEALQ